MRRATSSRREHDLDPPEARSDVDVETEWRATRIALQLALRRLGATASPAALRAAAPHELCGACGFTRAMFSAVRGTRWVPLVLYTQDDVDPEASAFRAFVASDVEIPLATMLAETEMVRRRGAVLISDALLDRRTFKPIIDVARSPGYVAAPLVVDGRTIGFLHADRVGQDRGLTDDDRRHIAAFASEVAVLYQHLWWTEVLRERQSRYDAAVAATTRALAPLAGSTSSLGTVAESTERSRSRGSAAPRRDALLSAREREILELVAEGATNAAIAARLALSEDTVKTHMRGVLRKLHVTNRGAAVARYVHLREAADD